MKLNNHLLTTMNEAEFIGKVNRFGSEYSVYMKPGEDVIRIFDENGTELKCNTKKLKDTESILDRVPWILQSVGL